MKKISQLLLTAFLIFTISCKSNEPVIANFEYNETANGEFVFTNTSSGADSYLWDFGSGNTTTEQDPTFTFDDNKEYTISLAAKGKGGQNQITKSLKVTSVPDNAAIFANSYSGKFWAVGGYSNNKANVVINTLSPATPITGFTLKKIDRTTLSSTKITEDWKFSNIKATSATTFVIDETIPQTDGSKAKCKGTGKLTGKNLEISFDSDNGYIYTTFLIKVAVQ